MKLSEIISILSISAFSLTVIYIYGFSLILDINIFNYFIINDYIKVSVSWLVPVIIGLTIGNILNYYLRRIEEGKSREELIQSSQYPKFTRSSYRIAEYFAVIVPLFAVVYHLYFVVFFDHSPYLLYAAVKVAGPILWMAGFTWYIEIPRLTESWKKEYFSIFMMLPALLIYSFFSGLTEGEKILKKIENSEDITIVKLKDEKNFKGGIIFVSTNYVIFLNYVTKNIQVFPAGEIKYIEHKKERELKSVLPIDLI